MKKLVPFLMVLCLLLAGCGNSEPEAEAPENPEEIFDTVPEAGGEAEEPAVIVYPIPDTTMENLTDAILPVSLEEGDAYVDDSGVMRMDVKIYTYDRYDMADIAKLKAGDIIAAHEGEIEVTAVEQSESGTMYINGGLDAGGFDLVPDDGGIFCEVGYNDAKNWYEVGEATIRVSVDFTGTDNADPDKGEVLLFPGGFLVGEVTDYHFTPHNTVIRVEDGQIVEMHRSYTP